MNFEQFQSSRTWHDDLSHITNRDDPDDPIESGYVYLDSFYITHFGSGEFVVEIGRTEKSFGSELEDAERFLWDEFAKDEIS